MFSQWYIFLSLLGNHFAPLVLAGIDRYLAQYLSDLPHCNSPPACCLIAGSSLAKRPQTSQSCGKADTRHSTSRACFTASCLCLQQSPVNCYFLLLKFSFNTQQLKLSLYKGLYIQKSRGLANWQSQKSPYISFNLIGSNIPWFAKLPNQRKAFTFSLPHLIKTVSVKATCKAPFPIQNVTFLDKLIF